MFCHLGHTNMLASQRSYLMSFLRA
jgi:hypothetical protein